MSIQNRDRLGKTVLVMWGLGSVPYYVIRYPRKTFNLIVHKIGWYD